MTTDVQEREPQVSENGGNGIPTDPAEMIARAGRILGGDIRPEDYLPVTHEIEIEVQATIRRLVRDQPEIIVSEEGTERVRRRSTLDYYCGGNAVLARSEIGGVIVLANGWENVMIVNEQFSPEHRSGYVLQFPCRWGSEG